MRQVIVESSSGSEEFIALRSYSDVSEYSAWLTDKVTDFIKESIVGDIPIDELENMVSDRAILSSVRLGVKRSMMANSESVISIGRAALEKVDRFKSLVESGEVVLVNAEGGWKTLLSDMNISDEWDYVEQAEETAYVRAGTKYINLENDPKLENRTIEYLSERDENFSYITKLNKCSREDLQKAFGEFVKNGGDTVYVYTTGIDVEQMYDYTDAAITSGIRKFEFEFNAGMTDGIEKFLEYMRGQHLDLRILNEEKPNKKMRLST